MDIRVVGILKLLQRHEEVRKHEVPKKKNFKHCIALNPYKNLKISNSNETYKTKLNLKSTMNLSFGKCNKKRLSEKAGMGNWWTE